MQEGDPSPGQCFENSELIPFCSRSRQWFPSMQCLSNGPVSVTHCLCIFLAVCLLGKAGGHLTSTNSQPRLLDPSALTLRCLSNFPSTQKVFDEAPTCHSSFECFTSNVYPLHRRLKTWKFCLSVCDSARQMTRFESSS